MNGRQMAYNTTFDHGIASNAVAVTRYFNIRNNGVTSITLRALNASLYDSNRWTITSSAILDDPLGRFNYGADLILLPGTNHNFSIQYSPQAGASQIDTMLLNLYSNDPIYPVFQATILGRGIQWGVHTVSCGSGWLQDRDAAAADPSFCLNMGPQIKGSSVSSGSPVFQITNTGAPFFTYTISYSSPQQYEFTLSGGSMTSQLNIESYQSFYVQFQPSIGGLREGIITITTDDPLAPLFQFSLQGYGTGKNQPSTVVCM
jgi:hypothetical protein